MTVLLTVVIGATFFLSSMIQGAIGIGFAMLASAVFAFFLPPANSSALIGYAAVIAGISLSLRMRAYIRMRIALPPLIAMMITRVLGVVTLMHMDAGLANRVLGAGLLLFALYFWLFGERVRIRPTAWKGFLLGLFAGLTVVCAWISIPLGPVPVTLQTFAVFLGAALLGSKRGTLAVAVYILLGVVGLPVFSGFKSLNPLTFGYVLGFLPLGMLTAAADRLFPKTKLALPLGMVTGLLVCYLIGTVWFYYVMHFRGTEYGFGKILSLCVIPFIVPDLVKLGLAYFLAQKLGKFVK